MWHLHVLLLISHFFDRCIMKHDWNSLRFNVEIIIFFLTIILSFFFNFIPINLRFILKTLSTLYFRI